MNMSAKYDQRDEQVYAYLSAYFMQHGCTPTHTHLIGKFGSTLPRTLARLEADGLITRSAMPYRHIRLTDRNLDRIAIVTLWEKRRREWAREDSDLCAFVEELRALYWQTEAVLRTMNTNGEDAAA